MNNLIELVFENVPDERLNNFASTLIGDSFVMSMYVSETDGAPIKWDGDAKKILNIAPSTSATISLSLDKVDWPLLSIQSPLLQVIKYDGMYDVVLSFLSEDISCKEPKVPIKSLHSSAVEFFAASEGEKVYCGYEPAQDESTRFFTNNDAGPLHEFW
jgi:hypothetical protein